MAKPKRIALRKTKGGYAWYLNKIPFGKQKFKSKKKAQAFKKKYWN